MWIQQLQICHVNGIDICNYPAIQTLHDCGQSECGLSANVPMSLTLSIRYDIVELETLTNLGNLFLHSPRHGQNYEILQTLALAINRNILLVRKYGCMLTNT